ncbi:MAG: HYR domain-containing protein [Saprospiraceae bacterium]
MEVEDNEAPTIICPNTITVNTDSGECTATAPNLGTPTTNDNCGVAEVTDNAPTAFQVGTTTVVYTVFDLSDNTATCILTVEVEDNEAPGISCPAAITVNTDAGVCTATAPNLGTPTTNDNCGVAEVADNAPTAFQLGTTTVVYTVTDLSGNTATCAQTVLVKDNEPPTISCPAAITVNTDPGVCTATAPNLGTPTTTDNCGVSGVSNNAPGVFPVGPRVVVYTVTDASGNTRNCTQNVLVRDNEAPVIACADTLKVNTDPASCFAFGVALPAPTTTDNCSAVNVTNNAPVQLPLGITNVAFTATDQSGNSSSCALAVRVRDNEPPTIICPNNVSVNTLQGLCYATTVQLGVAQVNDNCPNLVVTNNAPILYPLGPTNLTYTVTDAGGNKATCITIVTVTDNQPPVITCPANATVNANANCQATGVSIGLPQVTENCTVSSISNNAPTAFPVGTTQVVFTVTDNSGNTGTCIKTVTVLDNTPPTIVCPANITTSTTPGLCTTTQVVLGTPTVNDNCPGAGFNVDVPTVYPLGVTTVQYTAFDNNGNTATCTQQITVKDTQPPVINCPSAITLNTDPGACTSTILPIGSATATDNCGIASINSNKPGAFPLGATIVSYTATDVNGNTATCTQVVKVIDQEKPVFTACPSNISVNASTGLCTATVNWNPPVATDNCTNLQISSTHQPGAVFQVGPTTVVYTVTDVGNNSAVCSFVVTVRDQTPPVLSACPGNINVGNTTNACGANVSWTPPTASDNCGAVVLNTNHNPGAFFGLGQTNVVYTATDASGNSVVCTFRITVNDTQAPSLTCPVNITVNTPANNCFVAATWTVPTPTDNCPGVVISNATHQSGSSFQPGITTVRYTAVDAAGQSTSCTFTITVVDNVPPKAVCVPTFVVNLNANGQATLNPVLLNVGSTDNCGISTYNAQPAQFSCTQVGVQLVTLIVTDNAGNTATCTTAISVNASPVCTPPNIGNTGGPNIHDPCFCIGNGRFSEEVVIGPAGPGQAWRVSSTTLINPSTSLPYPVGTLFTEIPLGGGLSQYVLAGVHLDGVGYTVAAQSPFYPTTTLSIGNTCSYPDATIVAGDPGPYCQFTAPVTFTGSANGGIAGVGQFLVDNVPVTTSQNPPNSGNWIATVNVGSLGSGQHTLTFNFDAGNPAGQLPPANIGCTASENLVFVVSPAPQVLVCNPLTTVILGGACKETVTPDEVLSTNVGCIDDYVVTIVGPNGQIGNMVNGLNISQPLTVTVTSLVNGSSCTGDLEVVDLSGPNLVCLDVFVPCILTDVDPLTLLNLSIPNAFPTATDNCSAVNDFDFSDQLFDLGCTGTINNQTNMSAYILRTWTAKDEYGNSGQCQQFVYLQRLPVSQVQFPPNTTVSCSEGADPSITGTPFVTVGGTVFPVYPDAGVCELTAVYTDVVLPGTGCNTQTIQRTWSVFGVCQPGSVNPPNFNPRLVTQVIQVTDNTGPVVDCPGDITADANSGNCCASVNLPDVVVSDPCSRVKSARALVFRIDPQTGDTLSVFSVAGSLTNFPGNDPQDPDTLASYGTTTCLPIGQYIVAYLAEDACGNTGFCTFNMQIEDKTVPKAVCAGVKSVILNAQGQASLTASSFNNGSTDNCGALAFKARRQDAAVCQGNNQFFDNVLFCCEDVGDTAYVVLRVYDVPVPAGPVALNFEQDHASDCIALVVVRDTVAPKCVAPNDTVVACGTYTPDLGNFSDAAASDNCCLDTLLETLDLTQFDAICKRGIIQRTFTAVDCGGNSSTCRQKIQFNYIQTYVIQFPDDVVASACSTSGLFGEPEFFLNNCENLDVSFTDVSVPGPLGQCDRVERTWRIVNLCTFVPATPLTVVPNPQPDDDPTFADNLPGPIVSPLNTPSPWMPTVVALTPGAQPTNFSQYWSSNSNGYTYTQYIYLADDIDPVATTVCPADTVKIGDASNNDSGLWNATFWFDPLNTSNDLCEATAALAFSAEDNCGGNLLNLRYELFLDLDGNGKQETVVKSDSLPAVNTVRFNNLASGNVNGGTARAFDQRGLAVNQQYRFAIEKVVVGNQATGKVRWNTSGAPATYTDPQLPNGIHRIRWIAEDACGNNTTCEYVFTLRDTLAPTLVCQGGTFNLGPGGAYNLQSSSLFSSAIDNCTPQNKLNFSMRLVGSGNGFPLNPQGFPVTQLAFDCGDIGTQNIELWVADAGFNTTVCTTTVIIGDAVGFCSSSFFDVGGNIKNDKLVNYEGAEMSVAGLHPSGFTFANTAVTGTNGNYFWSNIAPGGAKYTVKPFADDNPLNGVFTSDLVFIQNHILQRDTLDTPYRVIAADANKSGAVTGLDITEIRKLILGINSKFPKNTSWRFVDKTWVFNNILNPFNPVFPETITIDPVTKDEPNLDFVALKVGDANGSAQPNNLISIDDRTAGQIEFAVEAEQPIGDRLLQVSESVLLRIRPMERVAGYQFTLSHAGLELLELLPGIGMHLDNFGVFPDKEALTTSWDGETDGAFELRLRVLKPGKLSDLLRVSGSITPAQAYRSIHERPLDVALSFTESGLVQMPDFELYQNRPNPFNDVTWIGFYLPEATEATLRILDETGRLVYLLRAGFDKGEQYIAVNADELGATGVLYYELTTPTNRAVKKMVRVER